MSAVNLYLSPHPDDVTFSCAGKILQDVAAGIEVVVVSIFSQGPDEDVRKAEDQRALEILGARPLWLDFQDAPLRNAHYNSFQRIIVDHDDSGKAVIPELVDAIRSLTGNYRPQQIFAPLAVGMHIDHALLFEATLQSESSVIYYEDRPYALANYATSVRLQHLGVHADPAMIEKYQMSLTNEAYVKKYLPYTERAACYRAMRKRLLIARENELSFLPETLETNQKGLERITEAVTQYQSQVNDFFGSLQGYIASVRSYAQTLKCNNSYAERYWRLSG